MTGRDPFFLKLLSEKIADTDFTGYTFQYPPLYSWQDNVGDDRIFAAWKKVCLNKPQHLGLYIHIPYCKQKCAYCRYFSLAMRNNDELISYVAALKKELFLYQEILAGIPIYSVYFGGGTPSLLSVEQLGEFFSFLRKNLNLTKCRQIIFEGNPDFLTYKKIKVLKYYGVNRLTIGVQSLDHKVIMRANRYQKSASFLKCFRAARRAKIENINIDLMAGLPGQSQGSFINTLNSVIRMDPEMIHVHPFYPTALTGFIQAGNKLTHGLVKERGRLTAAARNLIEQYGYRSIKFDAWGKSDAARNIQLSDAIEHNSPFLGLGSGATSHATGYLRYVNKIDVNSYIRDTKNKKPPVYSGCRLSKKDEMIYFCVASLRYGSIDKTRFWELFREDLNKTFHKQLVLLVKLGKIRETPLFIHSRMNNIADYTIYSKYFYDDAVLGRFRKEYPSRRLKSLLPRLSGTELLL